MGRDFEAATNPPRRRAAQGWSPALAAGPDGWLLAPEGAAVHPDERAAVIADVHLGYEWARGAGGDMVPAHSLVETTAKLARLLDRAPIDRLVVAGDLVESATHCPRTARDVGALRTWLSQRGIALVCLQGNHDPPRRPPMPETLDLAGWTIAHGHRPIVADRLIIGHHHPVLRAGGLVAPCFVVGPTFIALPAFSPNAAGLDVAAAPEMLPAVFRDESLGLLAGLGNELLDFGLLTSLRSRLRRV